jgi:hypothetical protein
VAAFDWPELNRKGELHKRTITQLQQYLEYYRLKKSGKKAELVERVEEHLASLKK